MIFPVKKFNTVAASTIISLRCPNCKKMGTFTFIKGLHDLVINPGTQEQRLLGQRACPNPDCKAHIFFASKGDKVVVSYPAERIDFDTTNLPSKVLASFEEAVTCHANQCYIAAAIMVRKTLEELCSDRGARGNNLKQRVKSLKDKVVLPKELLEGLGDLRLLGNDAAHVESREYDKIEQEEVEIGIEFTKEVLKAVYQYSALVERLQKLKKPKKTN